MPTWRCPHCAIPQQEAARCWVCRRSTTSCATCRHFRGSVIAGVGFCGLDRLRRPLSGDEMRPCWDGRRAGIDAAATIAITRRDEGAGRDPDALWVELEG